MESDEDLARRLQRQFDEEAQLMEERERQDAAVAQSMAATSHNLSDSDDDLTQPDKEEEEDRRDVRPRTLVLTPHKEDKKERGGRAKQEDEVKEHALSEEEEEEEQVKYYSPKKTAICKNSQESPESSLQAPSRSTQPSPQTANSRITNRPLCKFGSSCYRKNPWHLEEFYHPHLEHKGGGGGRNEKDKGTKGEEKKEGKKREGERTEERPAKAPKNTHDQALRPQLPFPSRHAGSAPFHLFLNKCYSVEATRDDPLTLVFPDLLHPALGTIVESAQLTFMADLEFLMTNYKAAKVGDRPLLLAYGEMEGDQADYPALKCVKVRIPFQYGTHHTKAMLFLYETGMRVVIHTANLVPNDWYEKTQGYWVSPLFPKLENGRSGILDGDSPTRFKRDLVEYLQAYKCAELTRWANLIKGHDFTDCRAVLVGSVPGYHMGAQKDAWGHTKVRRTLAQHSAPSPHQRGQRPTTIIQCSSIGSLGKDSRSWLSAELGLSLSGAKTTTITTSTPKMSVVYPSQEDVQGSSEGWMGGSCLPYNSATHEKQPWLADLLHSWRSEARKRTRAMPHIKTYTQVTCDLQDAHYLLLTSANLSKAAWGCLQKQGTQLFIRSYELGVLLLPKFVTEGSAFSLGPSGTPGQLTLPYDLPLTPYRPGASPWFMNTKKKEKDVFGRTYP